MLFYQVDKASNISEYLRVGSRTISPEKNCRQKPKTNPNPNPNPNQGLVFLRGNCLVAP